MTDARANILSRLRAAPPAPVPAATGWKAPVFGDGRLDRFRSMLESVHGEVHQVAEAEWPERLAGILAGKGVKTMLSPASLHDRLAAACAPVAVFPYDRPMEALKETLVHDADAAVTTAVAGIAETGSLVLWPDADQPRLMSLLPPIHVVLVRQDAIADSLADLMARDGWAARMPTNLVLVSGPSKTADIEQTLAYGVHGPKELIVLVLT